MLRLLQFVQRSDRGASMVEYGLLVVLIALIAILAVAFAGTETSTLWSEIASATNR